jgi:DNA-binding NarL/FixJ family response regulator
MNSAASTNSKHSRAARVVIVDDSDLARAGVRGLLDGEPGLEIVGEALTGQQAVEVCYRLSPDLVLMDVRMPEMDGLSATRAIKANCPTTSVIILTLHESADYLMAALQAGAAGYLLKDIGRRELLTSIKDVLRGKIMLNGALAAGLIRQITPTRNQASKPVEQLTTRELEVLRLLAQGLSNREIGQALSITPGTAKVHVEHILGKMQASDRTQAAVRAAEWGLLKSDTP